MTKQELRAAIKQKRAIISPEQKKTRDTAIVEQIAASEVFQSASVLLLYAPLKDEINLLPLARYARERGIPIAFPRCDTASNTMQFFILEPGCRLAPGAYGIPEPPADAPLCEPDENALCILPALTFDPTGARLGYGKGYYDRFLATFPGVRAGAVYESLLVRRVPTEPHDRPVALLFTEHECWDCRLAPPAQPTKKAHGSSHIRKIWSDFCSRVVKKTDQSRALVPKSTPEEAAPLSLPTPRTPPILVAILYGLLVLSRLIDTLITSTALTPVIVILLQLLIFALPAILYLRRGGKPLLKRMQLRLPKRTHLWFLLCMLVVMITGGLLAEILTGGIESLTGNFTLYDTFVASTGGGVWGILYLVLAYALLPALCEEIIFRGILCAEYDAFGIPISMIVSALFFALLHFSLPLLPAYLLLGILLACVRFATHSLISAVLLHLLYNLFCLFGQPYLSAFYVTAGSNEIFSFCLVTLLLLFSAFAAGEARKIYHRHAKRAPASLAPPVVPIRQLPKCLFGALATPATAVCLAIWLVMAIVNLF